MAQQTINFSPAFSPTDDTLPVGAAKINNNFNELYSLQSKTLNAADPRFKGATNEISISNSINLPSIGGIAVGASRIAIPESFIPFDASQITNLGTWGGQMVREGGDWTVFDARAYGAGIDGVRDDYNNLKALADALRAHGGRAFIGEGTCVTSGQIYWPQESIIAGAGRGVTIIQRMSGSITNASPNNTGSIFVAGSSDGVLYTVGSHGSKINFHDFTLDGNAAGNPGVTNTNLSCEPINIKYVDDVHLSQVEVMNGLESGVYLWGCRRSSHIAVTSHNNGQMTVPTARNGFHITGPQDDATDKGAQDDHTFEACESYSNTDEGITVGRNGRISIVGCFVHNNGDMGIEGDTGTATADTTSVPAGWLIEGCHIYSNGTNAIALGNSNQQRVAVTGNLIEDNPGYGIQAGFTSGSLITLTGNIIRNWGTLDVNHHGISIGTFDQVIVQGNVLNGGASTLSTGIVLVVQAAPRSVSIIGNQVLNAGGGGMVITGAATGAVAENVINTTVSAFTEGVLLLATTATLDSVDFHDNYITGCVTNGLRLRTNGVGNVQNVKVHHNTSVTNQIGIQFTEGGGGHILRTVFENNDLWGNSSSATSGLTAGMVARQRENQYGFPSSTDALRGTAVLSGGTKSVSNTEIQTGDMVLLTNVSVSGTPGVLSLGTIVNQTSFVINSSSGTDGSTVFYEIVH